MAHDRTTHILLLCAGGLLLALVADPQISEAQSAATHTGEAELETNPSIDTVQRYAVEHNPAIRAALKAWKAAQMSVVIDSSYENPLVTYMPNTNSMVWTVTGMETNGFGVSQVLPFPGKLSYRGRVATHEAASAYEKFRTVIQETERQVWVSYAGYYLADRALGVNEDTTRLARLFEAIAEAKYKVGKVPEQDVIQAQEEITQLAVQRVDLQKARNSAIGNLNTILDRAPRAPIGKPAELGAAPIITSLDQFVKESRTLRPELKAEEHMIKARESSVTLAKMIYLPDFQIGGQYIGVDGNTGLPGHESNGQAIWTAMIGLSVPIWLNRVGAQVDQAKAQLQQEKSTRHNIENTVADQVQNAYEQLVAAARNEAIYRTTLIPQTAERIRSAGAGYQTGIVDFLTLIDSLKSYEDVRLRHYETIAQYHVSGANLSRAVGMSIKEIIK